MDACYASEYGRTIIKQKSEADDVRKAALNAYLAYEPAQWTRAAKSTLDLDDGGFTGPDIELPKRVWRGILKKFKNQESSQSKDDHLDSTYVPDTESEEADTDSSAEDDEELGDFGDYGRF